MGVVGPRAAPTTSVQKPVAVVAAGLAYTVYVAVPAAGVIAMFPAPTPGVRLVRSGVRIRVLGACLQAVPDNTTVYESPVVLAVPRGPAVTALLLAPVRFCSAVWKADCVALPVSGVVLPRAPTPSVQEPVAVAAVELAVTVYVAVPPAATTLPVAGAVAAGIRVP
jgi:hypothetical protein